MLGCEKCIVLSVKSIKNLKSLKYIFVIKHYLFLVFVTSVEVKMKKYLMKTKSIEILKILNLINNM